MNIWNLWLTSNSLFGMLHHLTILDIKQTFATSAKSKNCQYKLADHVESVVEHIPNEEEFLVWCMNLNWAMKIHVSDHIFLCGAMAKEGAVPCFNLFLVSYLFVHSKPTINKRQLWIQHLWLRIFQSVNYNLFKLCLSYSLLLLFLIFFSYQLSD